ncbi:MAG: response regulator [Alphaproteobacteria bacterium]
MSHRVLLADDHAIVRNGIKHILTQEGFVVVGEASNGREAVQMTKELLPDVAILDFSMPLLNGIDAARQIREASPRTKTLLLTMYKDETYVLRALRAGINGYVVKTQAAPELVEAIRSVLHGGLYLSPVISESVVKAALIQNERELDPLTPREREVLQLIAEGKSNKQISGDLGMSVKTVDSHRRNLMVKLDIHETAGLVRYAIRTGLISP